MSAEETWRDVIREAGERVRKAEADLIQAEADRRLAWLAASHAGLSLRNIAEAAGVSHNTVSRMIGPVGRPKERLDQPIPKSTFKVAHPNLTLTKWDEGSLD